MTIAADEFERGYLAYQARARRDAMYKVATFLVSQSWGKPAEMADGMGVLLLTWNQAFYRYGSFDFDRLEQVIKENLPIIQGFRNRNILNFQDSDETDVKDLFARFLEALQIAGGKAKGRRSPVAVAKALHLLGPAFFALWDDKIARNYNCYYHHQPAEQYVAFLYNIKEIAQKLHSIVACESKTLVKLIDDSPARSPMLDGPAPHLQPIAQAA